MTVMFSLQVSRSTECNHESVSFTFPYIQFIQVVQEDNGACVHYTVAISFIWTEHESTKPAEI